MSFLFFGFCSYCKLLSSFAIVLSVGIIDSTGLWVRNSAVWYTRTDWNLLPFLSRWYILMSVNVTINMFNCLRYYRRITTTDRRRTNSISWLKWLRWHDICFQIFSCFCKNWKPNGLENFIRIKDIMQKQRDVL